MNQDIPGTTIFDGREAMKGYNLNKMCYSFNSKANRDAFLEDEDAYCERFDLSEAQRDAVPGRVRQELAGEEAQGAGACARVVGNDGRGSRRLLRGGRKVLLPALVPASRKESDHQAGRQSETSRR